MAFLKLFGLLLCAFLVKGNLNPSLQFPESLPYDQRIIQGNPASPGQLPFQVHLLIQGSSGGYYCGGSIISNRFILTAGHCVSGLSVASVRMGTTNINSGTVIQSSRLIPHPNYDSYWLHNDIALIELSSDAPFSELISAIQLPKASDSGETHEGVTARASGWGLTADGNPSIPNDLSYVDLRVISNTECAGVYGNTVIDSTICCRGIDNPAHSTCSGDSGGPLTAEESDGITQIGVVSFVHIAGCASGNPSGYARTNKHLEWISQNSGIPIRP